jgi:site-specific recombinase XerD
MNVPTLGALLHAFLADELPLQKGLRTTSIRAYRDALRLFLTFVAADVPCRLTQITIEALRLDRVLRFLQHLEDTRHNHRRTRNHRLTILHTFFEFLGRRMPEYLAVAQQIAAIPSKRVPPSETRFLDQDEIATLFRQLPAEGRFALRDRALLLMLYNSGGRVQEVADLRVEHLELGAQPRVSLHGKECHSYCISFRRRNETTIIHVYRQVCDLAFFSVDVLLVVRTGIGLGRYTDVHGAGRFGPMSEPYAP